MRIAQIAPLIESVPPRLYGGTERIVSYLTEELVAQGHDVTLFASGAVDHRGQGSCPAARRRCGSNPAVRDIIPYYMLMLDKVRGMAAEFDILHFHIDQFHFPIFHDAWRSRTVTTLHGRQDLPDLKHALRAAFPRCRWSRSRTRSARRSPTPTSSAPSTTACRRPARSAPRAARRLPGLPRPHLAREARRPRDRDRPRRRHAAARSPPRSTASTRPTSDREIEPLLDAARRRVHRRDRRPPQEQRSSARRARCCSRSTGPSRSGWS